MSSIGNFIWFICGGVLMGLSWYLAGLIAYATIVGIPWARACFVLGGFSMFPFGKEALSRAELTGQKDIGTGSLGTIGNVIWFVFAGLWLCLGHLLSALLSAATVIGLPFAIQHLKLAGFALAPIGKTVVTKEVAAAARNANAQRTLKSIRG
jgi:uncharacterized membrane protein YccF (DUF307 family)